MAQLQEYVMSVCPKLRTISLSLDKAPSWQVHGPSLRHMCLQIPPSTTIERGRLEDFEDASEIIPSARHLYSFKEMSGMHSNNLPNLQTLFLQGLREPVEVRGIDFHDSNTLVKYSEKCLRLFTLLGTEQRAFICRFRYPRGLSELQWQLHRWKNMLTAS